MKAALVATIFVTLFSVCFTGTHELLPYNPVANPAAVVVSGSARFTVLTPSLIRMEYASSGMNLKDPPFHLIPHRLPLLHFCTRLFSPLLLHSFSISIAYSLPLGNFEDRQTVAFVNRTLPVPAFTSETVNGWLSITTQQLVLKYKV